MAAPRIGSIIIVHTVEPIDGETEIAAVISKIDVEAGTINAQLFLPNGGKDVKLMTGLRTKAEIDALPDNDPDRNLPSWYPLP